MTKIGWQIDGKKREKSHQIYFLLTQYAFKEPEIFTLLPIEIVWLITCPMVHGSGPQDHDVVLEVAKTKKKIKQIVQYKNKLILCRHFTNFFFFIKKNDYVFSYFNIFHLLHRSVVFNRGDMDPAYRSPYPREKEKINKKLLFLEFSNSKKTLEKSTGSNFTLHFSAFYFFLLFFLNLLI